MVPIVLLALTALALILLVGLLANGRLRVDDLAEATHSTPDHGLPEHPCAADVENVSFDTAPRGYRTAEVDARMRTLQRALEQREAELATLRGPEEP